MVAWLVWAAATAGALMFVFVLGSNVPYWDEWDWVPVLTGNQPVTAEFLWAQHNEHRLPLSRLVYLGLFALFNDFRAGMAFNVLALSTASALLIVAASKARGEGSWTDGFVALALLNLGHADSMLWSFQVVFVLTTLLAAVALGVVAGIRETLSRGQAVGIAWPLTLAPFCGGPGVPLAVVAGAGFAWWAVRGPRGEGATGEGQPRPASRVLLIGLGFACWGVVAAYMFRHHAHPGHPPPAGMRASLRGAAEFLSLTLGSAGRWYWPWSAAVALGLVVATATAVTVWWWRSRRDRLAAESLLLGLGALAALAMAIGWGRSGFGPEAALVGRYATLAAPIALWVYLAWCRLPWLRVGRAVQIASFLAALGLYPVNFVTGREFGYVRRAGLQALVVDLQGGMPLDEVVQRHRSDVNPFPVTLREGLVMLRRLRLGPFSPDEDAAPFRWRFPFLKEPLVVIHEGMMTSRADRVGGRPVIVVHPNGDLIFDVRPGVHKASGSFGLLPAFYDARPRPGEPTYDGTYYQATFAPDEGEPVVVLSRLLDPTRNPSDRGLRPFRVSLPGSGGKLILSTRFGPPGAPNANGWNDWAFWADIDFR